MTWFGYTFTQWTLFFFLYSFLGWIWESCYVSLREKRWVNRGFLNGPLLPIYGFGAVSILLFTLPVAANPVLVFLTGMAGATLLEYMTGALLESTFHVRYWDYSMYRFNLNGYICLPASLCWGAFSLLMLRVIHPVVSGWVTMLAPAAALAAALALSAFFAVDLLASLRQAVDMRSLLQSLSDSRRHIAWMQKRYEVQAAFAPTGLTRSVEAVRRSGSAVQNRLQALRRQRRQLLHTLSAKAAGDADTAQLVRDELSALEGRTDSMYRRTLRHLRRNPGAVSLRYAEALQDIEPLLKG